MSYFLRRVLTDFFSLKIKISHLIETLSSSFAKLPLIFEHCGIAFYKIPVLLSLRSCYSSCTICFSMLIDFVPSALSILGRWKSSQSATWPSLRLQLETNLSPECFPKKFIKFIFLRLSEIFMTAELLAGELPKIWRKVSQYKRIVEIINF